MPYLDQTGKQRGRGRFPHAEWRKYSKSGQEGEQSLPPEITRFSRKMAGRKPVASELETAPLCACGCGKPVSKYRGTWNVFLNHHQRGWKQPQECATAARKRMSANNPMRRPEVALKVSKSTKGVARPKSEKALKNISAAARRRMLSDQNPMRDPAIHKAAMAKVLARVTSKSELHFRDWAIENGLLLTHCGDGTLWVGRRNPDFRVPGQKKVIEITMKECFAGGKKVRTAQGYGLHSISHYKSKNWNCLVVFKKDHRCSIPTKLVTVLKDFLSPVSNWSGVWNYDRLIPFEELKANV